MIIVTRIAPDVSGIKLNARSPVANHFEIGISKSKSKRGGTAARIIRLTRREQLVVDLLLEGCENSEIARQLRIAHRTVKAFFNRLFLRFGITSGLKRVKLATLLYRNQLRSDAILAGSHTQVNGNATSSLSSRGYRARGSSF